MRSVKEFSKDIVNMLDNTDFKGPYSPEFGRLDTPFENKEELIEEHLCWFLNDVLKCIENIDQTSLNKMDRAQRLIELEEKYGIPKTHTIFNHQYGRQG